MKTKEGVLKSPLTKICSLPHKEGQYEPESPRPFITKFQTKNLTSREVFYIKVTFLALLSWITLAIQLNIPSQVYIKLNSFCRVHMAKGQLQINALIVSEEISSDTSKVSQLYKNTSDICKESYRLHYDIP